MRVIVTGRLKQRNYETKEGEKRTVYEVEVDDVGPSLRNASAKVNRASRGGGEGGFGGGGNRSGGGSYSGGQGSSGGGSSSRNEDPWASDGAAAAAATPTNRRSKKQASNNTDHPRITRGSPKEHHDGEASNSQA